MTTRTKSFDDLPALLTPVDFTALTGVTVQTQANHRNQRTNGLPYIKVGRLVRYRRDDVLRWLDSRTVGALPAA